MGRGFSCKQNRQLYVIVLSNIRAKIVGSKLVMNGSKNNKIKINII